MTQSSSPLLKNGKLSIYIGLPGTGKTSIVLPQLGKNFVIVLPETTHPDILKLKYYYDDPEDLAEAARDKDNFCIFFENENPDIFQFLKNTKKTILLDDAGALVAETEMKRAFKKWLRNIRSRQQQVFVTTHRAKDDLPPLAYIYAREIVQVGPNGDADEVSAVYSRRDVKLARMTFPEFQEKILNLELYDYRTKNIDASTFKIKDI